MIVEVKPHLRRKKALANFEPLSWVLLLVLVTLVWCAAYNRWTVEAWKTPVSYSGDAWGQMAAAKGLATGDLLPVLPKHPLSLGAPFVASWNDSPITEEGVYCWFAILVRFFGLFVGSNLVLLSAHLLAAASFYYVCRTLGYERLIALAIAILFSMSGFAFARGLWHLVLTLYWHVPLGLLVAWWCVSADVWANKRIRLLSVLVSVLHGIQYIYFTGIFLQFLVLATLVCLIRRQSARRILFPLLLVAVVFGVFLLMNIDTFYYQFVNGPNPSAVVRHYSGLEIYGLRPVELVLPVTHRWHLLQEWTNRSYYTQTMFRQGENKSPYLGILAITALIWLAWLSLRAVAKNRSVTAVPVHFWGVAWVAFYSIIGGLNSLIGAFGLILFRGTNRYSVVILAIALLFLARELTHITRTWQRSWRAALALLLLVVGLWDQLPPAPTLSAIRQIRQTILSDGNVVASLEARLPKGAMIFELPVAAYPEIGPIERMLDYEHLRPYLHSRSLRFSYGSHKGRLREQWQFDLFRFGVPNAVNLLESYGFAAVLINKKGYADNALSLLAELQAAGRAEALAESSEFIAIALQPVAQPFPPLEFDQNWYDLEGSQPDHWRWSMGDANIILYNPGPQTRRVRLSFRLSSIAPRQVEVLLGGQRVHLAGFNEQRSTELVDITVLLRPGKNEMTFRTDRPAETPGTGDPRKLAFRIGNLTVLN